MRGRLPRLLAATLLLGPALAALPAGGLPRPGSDDAGSGTDAPDDGLVGLPIGPGDYQGNVTRFYDEFDTYRLDPPPRTVVRVRVEAPPVVGDDGEPVSSISAQLRGAFGMAVRWRDPDGFNLSMTAGFGRPMRLYLSDDRNYPERTGRVPSRLTYNLTVEFERHDHVAPLTGGNDTAAAWHINASKGTFARAETYLGEYGAGESSMTTAGDEERFGLWVTRPESGTCRSAWGVVPDSFDDPISDLTGRWGAGGSAPAWTQGLPRDIEDLPGGPGPIQPDRQVGYQANHGAAIWQRVIEGRDGFEVDVGYANSEGVPIKGWVIWDGDRDRVRIANRSARAGFWTLEQFNGSGPAVEAGQVAYAENLSKGWRLPGDEPAARFVWVDANTPKAWVLEAGVGETSMTVTTPNGSSFELVDADRLWMPYRDSWPGIDPARPGDWRVDVRHSAGWEGDEIRVAWTRFGFDPACPS